MELAVPVGTGQSRLTMAAISHVFMLKYVAEQLGEDEEWLRDLHVDMEPEDGCLWVHGVGEGGVPAFTLSPTQSSATSPGYPSSTTLGTSFRTAIRFGAVTASARS